MNPLVLMYNLKAASQVDALCREIGAQAQVIPPHRQGLPLGALVGLLPEKGCSGTVPGEMLVLCYFDRQMLDDFLQGFRRRQIPPIPRKAMLTLTNTAWTGPQLYENLTQEMQAMAQDQKHAPK